MPKKSEPVLLGKVVATHGIKGQLRVAVYSGDFATILSLGSIMLKGPDGRLDTLEVAASTVHGKKLIVSLKEYENINQVLHLVGRELYTTRDQMPEFSRRGVLLVRSVGPQSRNRSGGMPRCSGRYHCNRQ